MSDHPKTAGPHREPACVLVMDDELETADIVRETVTALRAAGYRVDVTDRMEAVHDAYYTGAHQVYVLDIDMSATEPHGAAGGTRVSGFLRAMDCESRVIVFSARGGVESWFAAANHHVFAYVWKTEPDAVGTLVRRVGEALLSPAGSWAARPVRPPPGILLCAAPPCVHDGPAVRRAVEAALPDRTSRDPGGGWELLTAAGLDEAAELAARLQDDLAAVVLVTDHFDPRHRHRATLDRLCALRPAPQVLLGCRGEEGARFSLLAAVNARPFRLLDTLAADFEHRLGLGLRDALTWYGRPEILPADPEHLGRLDLGFSDETLAEMGVISAEDPEEEEEEEHDDHDNHDDHDDHDDHDNHDDHDGDHDDHDGDHDDDHDDGARDRASCDCTAAAAGPACPADDPPATTPAASRGEHDR